MDVLSESLVLPCVRLRGFLELRKWGEEVAVTVEPLVNEFSCGCKEAYVSKSQQILYNLQINPRLLSHFQASDLVSLSDEEFARNTPVEAVRLNETKKLKHVQNVLKEKYDKSSAQEGEAPLRCRGCGGNDLALEQKQLRGADESMTVFVSCNKCNNRWKM